MTATRLLRLYPRAWRERYGEEFLATIGEQTLSAQQIVDITAGAIDAWLSADVRTATRVTSTAAPGGGIMTLRTMVCGRTATRHTTRDSLIGVAVLFALTAILALAGNAVKRDGWPVAGEMLQNLAMTAPFMLSMPFWLMKGQHWKVQTVVIGVTLTLLTAASWFAAIT